MNQIKTCLLIDDDQDDQEIFLLAANECGKAVKCYTVNSGVSALMLLDENPTLAEFIFLDLNMPGMNGKQCLAEIKKRKILKDVPVIIYSTSSLQTDIIETKELGAAMFITKPSSLKDLTKTLADFFGTH